MYRGDDEATERARGQVRELDELAAQREAEMQGTLAQAQDRLQRHRLEVQPTEMVELPEEPGQGDPSGPAVIPGALSAPGRGHSTRAGDHPRAGAAGA